MEENINVKILLEMKQVNKTLNSIDRTLIELLKINFEEN